MMNATTDPWVITPREKFKYQEQFKTLQPQNGFVTGAQAKGFFLQSQLPPIVLGHIWALADTDSDGNMNINEFSIACKLINLKLRGMELPKVLPPSLLSTAMASGISVGVSPTPTLTPTAMSPLDPLKAASVPLAAAPVTTLPGIVPATLPGIMPQVVAGGVPLPGMVPNAMTGPSIPLAMATQAAMMPPPAMVNKLITSPPTVDKVMPVPAPPTPPQSQPPSRNMSISERAPSMESLSQGSVDWIIKAPAKRKYSQVFNATDRQRTGYLTGVQARGILMQSKLPQNVLAQIWTLSDLDSDGRLSCDEFILAMFLCDKAMNGEKIPTPLPVDWIPPSFRKNKSRQGSVSGVGNSRGGSVAGSRHASVSSQGALDADPAAGLPQTSFEDKRKENFDKGQAELDRRRKLLQDQQRKEKEERERKEREETEKRERARLEAERKQQEELERQLQKQRELEMEREEQRKRELEAKEAARKELEKQRQQEWEQARIAEMNTHKEREQERVLKQKAHNTQLHVELSTLNEKIKDLSQKICDTRAGVTNVKSVIDGMRTQRDTSMSEMAQLKARIKEQNTKLMQLTQERSKWDAKSKAAGGGVTNAGQAEALNAAFANKQLIIKQLKDKVENISKEIEAKKEDINSNDVQVAEVKGELSALIGKCEELYADYDKQRTQVLELKYNKKNEHVSSSSAAWDTGSSSAAWGAPAAATNSYEAPSTVEDTSGPAPEGFVKYRAVYEFSARNADEITFGLGDIILVPLEQNAEPGWLAGEINGHTGWFPETYVEKLDESATEQSSATTATTAAFGATTTNTAAPTGLSDFTAQDIFNENTQIDKAAPVDAFNGDVEYYIAAYPYDSAEPGDLNFGAGEMVMVIKKEGDWWTGTIGNRTGMFPSNYVQKADVGQTTTATEVATAGETKEAPEVTTTTANNFNTDNDDFSTLNDAAQLNAQTNDYISSIIAAVPAALDISASSATTATTTTSAYHMEFNTETTTTTTPFEQYAGNNIMTTTKDDVAAVSVAAAAAAAAYAEERRTNDDLDTEVSQINTQSNPLSQAAVAAAANNETSASESYSRPMSRTSSMTPGMRAKRSDIAQVIAPYEATSAEQLSLTRGQLIMIRKKTDSGWWEGELQAKGRRRQIGWFPATYVKVLQGGRNSGRNTPVSGSRIEMTETILDKVIALYPYKAQNDDELSFDKDDIISVLGRDEPEWWRGELNGLTGLFPSNYVGPFVTSGNV